MGFGKIPLDCYNGHARVVSYKNFPVFLAPDSLNESSTVIADIRNNAKGQNMILSVRNIAGYYESLDIRSDLKEKSTELFFKKQTQTVPLNQGLDSFSVSDLKNLDLPVTLYYEMKLTSGNESHIYFDPFLNYGLNENPFKSAVREYPIEMPFPLTRTYELTMDIPFGSEIDEMPKSEMISLNESDGFYEYKIETSGARIHLKTVFTIKKATFDPEEYEHLRDFFAKVVKKQNEMIVFKRKG
jgi:hypothetical protein